ncbi:hypothetical protein os4_19510 [Comamonadaceae bacterium OS-4]|nr:hypothetical protein os4_19510 [Comamonadaceae bacterium OS-4]
MLHPIFHLIATQPQLLGNHAQAYSELIGTELAVQSAAWIRRALLGAATVCLLGVAVVLAGVALMLWVTPMNALPSATLWVLALVPAVPAVMAAVCGVILFNVRTEPAFAELRRQAQADIALLRSLPT